MRLYFSGLALCLTILPGCFTSELLDDIRREEVVDHEFNRNTVGYKGSYLGQSRSGGRWWDEFAFETALCSAKDTRVLRIQVPAEDVRGVHAQVTESHVPVSTDSPAVLLVTFSAMDDNALMTWFVQDGIEPNAQRFVLVLPNSGPATLYEGIPARGDGPPYRTLPADVAIRWHQRSLLANIGRVMVLPLALATDVVLAPCQAAAFLTISLAMRDVRPSIEPKPSLERDEHADEERSEIRPGDDE